MEPILKVEGLTKLFPVKKQKLIEERRYVHAVEDVSFEVYEGGTLGIVGESGSGKSTLARAILALTPATSGSVYYQGEDITNFRVGAAKRRRLRSELQMVFQDPYASLNPRMKIGEAIVEPMLVNGQAKTRSEAREKACHLLETVGLRPEVYDRFPYEFSGGQRQRIGIARAIVLQPSLVVCDEPVSALDVSIQSQVLNLLRKLQQSMGMAYIFISHNLSVIKHISDRVMVMYLGHVVEMADKKELFDNASHPYTQALLSAIPIPERHSKRKKIILQGDLPSPANPPSGCIFHTRCFMAQEICSKQKPELKEITDGHLCACHFCGQGQIPCGNKGE